MPEDLHDQETHTVEGEIDFLSFFSDPYKRPYKRLVSLVMELDGSGAEQRTGRIYTVSGIVNVTSHRKRVQGREELFAFSEDFILAWGEGDLEIKVNWAG